VDKATISAVMRAMGRKGGKRGAQGRMEKLTPERRSEIARKAGLASGKARKKAAAKKRARGRR
jgi:general stress protein YciG